MSISCRRLEDVIAVSAAGVQYRIERHLVHPHATDKNPEPGMVLECRLSTGGTVIWEGKDVYRLKSGEILRPVNRRKKKNVNEG